MRPGSTARRLDTQHTADYGGTKLSFTRHPHARANPLVEALPDFFLLPISPFLQEAQEKRT